MEIISTQPRRDPAWPLGDAPAPECGADGHAGLNRQVREQLIARAPFVAPERAQRFGRYIRLLRESRGWTRLQLAKHARLDPVAVGMLEAGGLVDAELSARFVSCLAEAFDIAPAQLVCYPTPAVEATLRRAADEPNAAPYVQTAPALGPVSPPPPSIDWATLLRPAPAVAALPPVVPAYLLARLAHSVAASAGLPAVHRAAFATKSATAPANVAAASAAPGEPPIWHRDFDVRLRSPETAGDADIVAPAALDVLPGDIRAILTLWVPDAAQEPTAAIQRYGLVVSIAGQAATLGPAAFARSRRGGAPGWRARIEPGVHSALLPAALRAAAEADSLRCDLRLREEHTDGR